MLALLSVMPPLIAASLASSYFLQSHDLISHMLVIDSANTLVVLDNHTSRLLIELSNISKELLAKDSCFIHNLSQLPVDRLLQLQAFFNADWGTCPDTRRSITGSSIFLGQSLISRKLKKQSIVSKSSAEAEYCSLANTTCEILWLHDILTDFGISSSQPTTIHCDSQAAIHISENAVFHERTKHVNIDCHIV
uniref:Retrovirus-related Pol polyprotein from transposon TNT 1-94 n=1 Tax=Cannabis sativa TaxID=3483 RepID=A0A803Q649_CANSA